MWERSRDALRLTPQRGVTAFPRMLVGTRKYDSFPSSYLGMPTLQALLGVTSTILIKDFSRSLTLCRSDKNIQTKLKNTYVDTKRNSING